MSLCVSQAIIKSINNLTQRNNKSYFPVDISDEQSLPFQSSVKYDDGKKVLGEMKKTIKWNKERKKTTGVVLVIFLRCVSQWTRMYNYRRLYRYELTYHMSSDFHKKLQFVEVKNDQILTISYGSTLSIFLNFYYLWQTLQDRSSPAMDRAQAHSCDSIESNPGPPGNSQRCIFKLHFEVESEGYLSFILFSKWENGHKNGKSQTATI